MARLQRASRGGFGLILLAAQIMQIGPDRIPPVTLVTIIINVAIYMRLIPNIPSVNGACTSNVLVVNKKQWLRLCTSSFYHLDDMHLYFNMASFIWKGLKLERKMRSLKFLIVLVWFSVLTQVVMLLLNQLFAEVFLSREYLSTCAAGFSAVIFALKVLTTFRSDENTGVMGLPILIPSRYACWVELILIHILVPNSSFTGHLAGILVGMLYVYGPLKKVVKLTKYLVSGDLFTAAASNSQHPYTRQAAPTGRRDSDEDVAVQEAIQASLRQENFSDTPRPNAARRNAPSYGWNIPAGESSTPQGLYPDIPTNLNADSASAPPRPSAPLDADYDTRYPASNDAPYPPSNNAPYPPSNNAPYPPSNNAPYPPSNNAPYPPSNNAPYPSSNNAPYPTSYPSQPPSMESQEDAMRKARLRKFEKNN